MKPERTGELLNRIYDGGEATLDVEYIGRFVVNEPYSLRVPPKRLHKEWSASVVPVSYYPLYGLKCAPPELAGGLFDEAPFPRLDRSSFRNQALDLPLEPEPLFDLCSDFSGGQFWVGESGTVYGHNLNNRFARIGDLADVVDFAVDMALDQLTWHENLRDAGKLRDYNLSPTCLLD